MCSTEFAYPTMEKRFFRWRESTISKVYGRLDLELALREEHAGFHRRTLV